MTTDKMTEAREWLDEQLATWHTMDSALINRSKAFEEKEMTKSDKMTAAIELALQTLDNMEREKNSTQPAYALPKQKMHAMCRAIIEMNEEKQGMRSKLKVIWDEDIVPRSMGFDPADQSFVFGEICRKLGLESTKSQSPHSL